jgi:hypothetical protein
MFVNNLILSVGMVQVLVSKAHLIAYTCIAMQYYTRNLPISSNRNPKIEKVPVIYCFLFVILGSKARNIIVVIISRDNKIKLIVSVNTKK